MKSAAVSQSFHRVVLACVLASLAVAASAPALAAGKPITQSMVVRFYDLNLALPDDVSELYTRINRAARRVCQGNPIHSFTERADFERCREVAVGEAVRKVGNQQLIALHDTRQGKARRYG